MKGGGRMCRNLLANLSHFHELYFPILLGFMIGQVDQEIMVSLCIKHDGIGSYFHGFEFFMLDVCFRVMKIVQDLNGSRYFLFQVQKSFMEHFISQNCMPGGTLFLKLGKDTGFVGGQPLLVKVGEYFIPVGAALPERNNLFCINYSHSFIALVRNFRTVMEGFQILQTVNGDFGVGWNRFRRWPTFANDEFARVVAQTFVLHKMIKRLCPAHGY